MCKLYIFEFYLLYFNMEGKINLEVNAELILSFILKQFFQILS